jgi:hypothetical protein
MVTVKDCFGVAASIQPEYGGSMLMWNIRIHLQVHTCHIMIMIN